jgi:hypothetical protein
MLRRLKFYQLFFAVDSPDGRCKDMKMDMLSYKL